MVESRYLQYEKKTKKVMKPVTPGATVSGQGGGHMGSHRQILENNLGAFVRWLCGLQAWGTVTNF